jgi:hypothetical protein
MTRLAASFAEFATAALPALTALMGISLGWVVGRGRERREMRRAAYVEWQRAARLIGAWPADEPVPPPDAEVGLPHPRQSARLNDATIELSLLASNRVKQAADAYLEKLVGEAIAQAVTGDQMDLREAASSIDEAMKLERDRVTELMRRDLGTRR